MPVIPQFEPGQSPDTIARLGLAGENSAQSWMTQAEERKGMAARTAQTDVQTSNMRMLAPALLAKANADRVTAENQAASATAQQELRAKWAPMAPQVIQDISDLNDPYNQPATEDGTPDWDARYQAYESLQAKYSGLALIPELKPYYDMIEQGKKDAFDHSIKHGIAQNALDRVQAAAAGRAEGYATGAASRVQVANIAAGSRERVEGSRASSRTATNSRAAAAADQKEALGQATELGKNARFYDSLAFQTQDPTLKSQYQVQAKFYHAAAERALAGSPSASAPAASSAEIKLPDIPGAAPAAGEGDQPGDEPAPAAGEEPAAPGPTAPQFTPEEIQAELDRRKKARK